MDGSFIMSGEDEEETVIISRDTAGEPMSTTVCTEDGPMSTTVCTEDEPMSTTVCTEDEPMNITVCTEDEPLSTTVCTDDEPLITALPLLYRLVLTNAAPKQLGLTKTQLIIMLSLSHFETLRMSQIADFISSSKEQATRAVAPLAEEGYVCRSNDPDNRTYIEISFTDKGRTFMEHWHCHLLEQLGNCLSRELTNEERAELRQASGSMVRILSKLR